MLAAAIIAATHHPLLVLTDAHRIEVANPAFLEQLQVSSEETIGRELYELGNRKWNIPDLRDLLEDVLSRGQEVRNYRLEQEFERIGRKIMLLNVNRIVHDGAPHRLLLALADVTEREQLLFDLAGRQEFAEKLIDSVREGLVVLSWDLHVRTANQSFYQTFEVDPADTEGRLIYELGQRPVEHPAPTRAA